MTIKPILFNTDMVRAIVEGRKTQTRRVIKPQPTKPRWNNVGRLGWDDGHGYRMKPPCEVGDVLWVRETFTKECERYYFMREYAAKEEADARCTQLIKTLKSTIDLAGFDLIARIEVRDRNTGRTYR